MTLSGGRRTRPRRTGAWLVFAAAFFVAVFVPGCAGSDELFVLPPIPKVDAAAIDRDPSVLLPRGPVLLGYLDAAALFQTPLGPDVTALVKSMLPLSDAANFQPARDVTRVFGGIYAMQGADFCSVIQGNFDIDTIRRTSEAPGASAFGAPLVKSRYADMDVYTAGNVGFSIVTAHTLLTGNETGIRRALDRLRRGTPERSLPKWMVDLVNTTGASMAIAGDVEGEAAVEAAARTFPFLGGLRKARIVGNFKAPGVNFAGTLTYSDETAAAAGATALKGASALGSLLSFLFTWGLGSAPPMDVRQHKGEVAFTTAMDQGFARTMINAGAQAVRAAASAAIQARP